MFRRKHSGYITFPIPIEKEVTRIDKNGKEITKIYLTYYNFVTTQDSWQAHYQILSIIFPKEFIELNLNRDMIIKDVKLVELNISITVVFMNT